MEPSYSPKGSPLIYQVSLSHNESPKSSLENEGSSPIASALAHYERTRTASQDYLGERDIVHHVSRKNSKKSPEQVAKVHHGELPIVQEENEPNSTRVLYFTRPRKSSEGEHSRLPEEKKISRTKSFGGFIRKQFVSETPKSDPYKKLRLTIEEPKGSSTFSKTPDEFIALLTAQDRAFSRFGHIIIENDNAKKIIKPDTVPHGPNRLNELFHQILSSTYSLGYTEDNQTDSAVEDQIELLLKLAKLRGQSLGIMPSQFNNVVTDHIPAYPLLLRVFSYIHGATHARSEIFPFLFPKASRAETKKNVLKDGKMRFYIKTNADKVATAFIKVQEGVGKAIVSRKEHYTVNLHILQKTPHNKITKTKFSIGTMDIFYSHLPVKSPRAHIDVYPCNMKRKTKDLLRETEHKDTEIEAIYLKVREALKKAFQHVAITKKEIELYEGCVLRTEKRGSELAEELKTFSQDDPEVGEVVSSPQPSRKHQTTEPVKILQTAPQGTSDESANIPQIDPQQLSQEKTSRSPPVDRKLNLQKKSDSKKSSSISKLLKKHSKRDTSDLNDPYRNLRMTVTETEGYQSPVVSRSPGYFLEVCARVGKAQTSPTMFYFDQLYLEKGDKHVLFNPLEYENDKKNFKDFLRDLLNKIYKMGYVDVRPSPDELERQLDLFFSFDQCYNKYPPSHPLERLNTYAALIPAYPILMRLAPTSSVCHYARTTALPAFFASNKNEIIDEVKRTGHPKYYVKTRVNGNKFATIQINGKENATVSQNFKYQIELDIFEAENEQTETETVVKIKETPFKIGTLNIIDTFYPSSDEHPCLSRADIYPRNLELVKEEFLKGTEWEGTDVERVFIHARKHLLESFHKPISNGTHHLKENFILCVESES